MDRVVPWRELVSLIEPYCPNTGKGRPPIGVERMLRIYFLQQWKQADPLGPSHGGQHRRQPGNERALAWQRNRVGGDQAYQGQAAVLAELAPRLSTAPTVAGVPSPSSIPKCAKRTASEQDPVARRTYFRDHEAPVRVQQGALPRPG